MHERDHEALKTGSPGPTRAVEPWKNARRSTWR